MLQRARFNSTQLALCFPPPPHTHTHYATLAASLSQLRENRIPMNTQACIQSRVTHEKLASTQNTTYLSDAGYTQTNPHAQSTKVSE